MATFEKEIIFNLENSIEYTDGGVISKQITKSKGGNLTLFLLTKNKVYQSIKHLTMPLCRFWMAKQK